MTVAKQRLKKKKTSIRNGYHVKVPADTILIEFEKIRKKSPDNEVTPEAVLDAAKNPKNPLHGEFEWDDTAAARKFRLNQARYLIRSIEIEYETIPMGPAREVKIVRAPAFSNTRPKGTPEGRGYTRTVDIVDDPQLRTDLLQEALRDINRFKIKYAILGELSGVLDEMNKVIKRQQRRKKK